MTPFAPAIIIQIGPLSLGYGGAALLLLLILIGGFVIGMWFKKKRQEKLALRTIFAESEIAKMFKLIMDDVEKLSQSLETPTTADDDYTLERLKNTVKKMELYLKKEVETIKR